MTPATALRAGLLGALLLGLTACSQVDDPLASPDTPLTVAAAFYPLEFTAQRIGGDRVTVLSLTPPGTDPHSLELSPAGIREVRTSDLVLHLSGFQHRVDDAIASTSSPALDVADVITLRTGDHDHDEEGPEHEDAPGDHVDVDPHFWLDPTLLALYAEAVADRFSELDPEGADVYRANYEALREDLTDIDTRYSDTLTPCQRDTILVSHEAFGYLSARYGLIQVGLSGLDPDAEPSPARIRELRELAREAGATTVFLETLTDPSAVQAFAQDAGLAVAILDPIGGLVDPGDDYLLIMERNLEVLKVGLGCG